MRYTLLAIALILGAVFSRFIPHMPNFTPIAAIALAGGVYLDKRFALLVPLAALLVSDYFIGFYSEVVWVYSSFLAIGVIGLWVRNHKNLYTVAGATFTGSVLFFVVTNFGVWAQSGWYPKNVEGLVACYTAAIPFFRNSLFGDLVYTAVLFGILELAQRLIPHPAKATNETNI
jgi:hypothetical protein